LDSEQIKIYGIMIPATVSIVVAVLAAYFAGSRERHKRLIDLYGKAYETIMSWSEMVYRIRRRDGSTECERQLVGSFHDIQERLNYHKGWISVESLWLGRSFDEFVKMVKTKTQPHINAAWKSPIRKSPISPDDDIHPDLDNECKSFLFDVRCQLAPRIFLIPYLILIFRNIYRRKQ